MKVTTDACLFGAWCAQEIAAEPHAGKRLLDVGAGTGLLSLMVAQKTNIVIDAVEIDEAAARQAYENAKSFTGNIHVHHHDILNFSSLPYDYVVSNPPFYEDDLDSPSAKRSVAHHQGGLTWKELFKVISEKLTSNGKFFLLLPAKRSSELNNLMTDNHLFLEKEIAVSHSIHHQQTRWMIQGSKKKKDIMRDNIIIKDGESYSPKFISLLKDYYLYL